MVTVAGSESAGRLGDEVDASHESMINLLDRR